MSKAGRVSTEQALEYALSHHQAGNLKEAETIYQRILKKEPRNHNAMRLLGLVAYRRGKIKLAVKLIKNAIAINGRFPAYYNNLGEVFRSQHQFDAAIRSYRLAIKLNPEYADAYNNLANAYAEQGDADNAVANYNEALRISPDYAEAHYNLGVLLNDQSKHAEAEASYRRALELTPDHLEAHHNLGLVLAKQHRTEEAKECFVRAVQLDPSHITSNMQLANLLELHDRTEAAIGAYRRVLQVNPDHKEASLLLARLLNEKDQHDEALGLCRQAMKRHPNDTQALILESRILREQGQLTDAITICDRVLAMEPDNVAALNSMGQTLMLQNRHEEAISCYEHALHIDASNKQSYNNLGVLFYRLRNQEKAIQACQHALEIDPDYIDASYNLAHALLRDGDFSNGWEKYEQKQKRNPLPGMPTWDGSPLAGKNILVTAEQGVGDEVMFASCIPDLMQAGPENCVLECDSRLRDLFSRSFPDVIVKGERHRTDRPWLRDLPQITTQVASSSLPRVFRQGLDQFPVRPSYLVPDAGKTENWKYRLSALGNGLHVGISWRGGAKQWTQEIRSAALAQWQPVFDNEACFINLQYGDCEEALAQLEKETGVHIHDWEDADPMKDLDGFAAQIAALDLVISIDNSTVHMAGAVGTEVWTLLPFSPEWRWMLDREDTHWYQTMRLFRQKSFGDWDGLFREVGEALAAKLRIASDL